MSHFTKAVVIFNPNSTGNSQAIAREFCVKLRKLRPSSEVILKETTHAGHGKAFGYELTKASAGQLLLVSVSSDGGYNELINGVMKAVDAGASAPICAILSGGNANDHYGFVAKQTLLEAIAAGGQTKLDLFKVVTDQTRYAHSYVGLGCRRWLP